MGTELPRPAGGPRPLGSRPQPRHPSYAHVSVRSSAAPRSRPTSFQHHTPRRPDHPLQPSSPAASSGRRRPTSRPAPAAASSDPRRRSRSTRPNPPFRTEHRPTTAWPRPLSTNSAAIIRPASPATPPRRTAATTTTNQLPQASALHVQQRPAERPPRRCIHSPGRFLPPRNHCTCQAPQVHRIVRPGQPARSGRRRALRISDLAPTLARRTMEPPRAGPRPGADRPLRARRPQRLSRFR
jgi:hypothetical protein